MAGKTEGQWMDGEIKEQANTILQSPFGTHQSSKKAKSKTSVAINHKDLKTLSQV